MFKLVWKILPLLFLCQITIGQSAGLPPVKIVDTTPKDTLNRVIHDGCSSAKLYIIDGIVGPCVYTGYTDNDCWASGNFERTDIERLPTNDIHYIQTFFPLH